jgi:hypothetical protein
MTNLYDIHLGPPVDARLSAVDQHTLLVRWKPPLKEREHLFSEAILSILFKWFIFCGGIIVVLKECYDVD